jgi:F0F1-type ATP synthase assembly protein I
MREAVRSVVILQFCIAVGAGLIAALVGGLVSALSALVGGALGVVPTLVYGLTVRLVTSAQPARVAGIHFVAEFLKIVATLALFSLAILYLDGVQFFPLIATFCLTLIAYWITLYTISRAHEHQRD